MTRRRFLTGLGPAVITRRAFAQPRRPNVVFIMTDDHGAWALGSSGCKDIHTPNLDRLAAGGARFTQAYAATPVCSPSRMTYLTGRVPSTHGVQDWLRPVDSFGPASRRWLEGHPTFTEILAKAGYELGMCGKWHMGHDDQPQAGFSYWATVPGGGGTYRNPVMVHNGKQVQTQGYKTDLVGDAALDFLDQSRGGPFFLYLPFYAPHTPYDFQPESYRAPYADSDFSCFPNTKPHDWTNATLRRLHGVEANKRAYSSLVTGVDANVGRIEKKLEQLGVRDNTLVIFTADQGWNAGHHGFWGKGNGTWPFNMYEESIRVPMIWNHPGRIRAGQILNPMVSSYDFFPTILDYLDVAAPPDAKRPGRSYAGFLTGDRPRWGNTLFFEYSYVRAIRSGKWKFIERTQDWPSEFYDLDKDPDEENDLFHSPGHRGRREQLRVELREFFDRLGAPPLEKWLSTTSQELTRYNR